jgi:hypothetical protein
MTSVKAQFPMPKFASLAPFPLPHRRIGNFAFTEVHLLFLMDR